MRKVLLVGAAALTILLTASPALAQFQATGRTFASCRAQGQFAICIASGNTHHPLVIRVHVNASPNQGVFVTWNMVCSKGMGAGGSSGQFHATTPVSRRIHHPYFHPGNCTVAAGGSLDNGGHVHVWLTATHW